MTRMLYCHDIMERDMNLQIRDPKARELAEKLAARRNVTMTEAVIGALEAELKRETASSSTKLGVADLVKELRDMAKPGGRDMTKEEIDAMWGHE
ncbi:MAG: type II toxin-antitoxin system VapB family antitoxin [Rhizobiaceae bacterium]